MSKRNIPFVILVLLYVTISDSCKNKQMELAITINKSVITDAVSSGSGLAYFNNAAYFVGDDASYIAVMPNTESNAYTRIGLRTNAGIGRVEKAIKQDLEAALVGTIGKQPFLFAFGSGSLSPYRDTVFAIDLKNNSVSFKCSLLPLYKAIKTKAALKDHQLNIEGAALAGEKLLLFNRGNNIAIIIAWAEFIKYIQEPIAIIPKFKIQKISLPVVNNFSVGISGACALGKNEILFTASLEETHDNIADGLIKGSYIGVLRLNDQDEISLLALQQFIDEEGNTILDKLEAIEIIKQQGNSIQALAMADNDDGKSKLFYLDIKRK